MAEAAVQNIGTSIRFPYIDANIDRMIDSSLLFAPWIGDIEYSLEKQSNGEMKFVPTRIPNSIVSRIKGFGGDGGDTVQVPLLLDLEGPLLMGDHYYPSTGEELRWEYKRCYVNTIAKTVVTKKGSMDDLRKADFEKDYNLAKPALVDKFRKGKNGLFFAAIYEGHSSNITAGLDIAPNGIGAKKILHPNLYMNNADAVVKIGTIGKNKKVDEMTAAINTNYADLDQISVDFLTAMATTLEDLSIPQSATYKGVSYWLAGLNRALLATLKKEEVFRKAYEQAFMGKEYDNPMHKQKVFIWEEFMFLIDNRLVRSWDNTAGVLSFEGVNGYEKPPTYATSKENYGIPILAKNALGYGDPVPYQTRVGMDNFDLNAEMLALNITGVTRNDHVAEADLETFYSVKNATTSTLDEIVAVTNQSSAIFMVGKGVVS